jgi:ABC-type Fe3+ transport system permease subunit
MIMRILRAGSILPAPGDGVSAGVAPDDASSSTQVNSRWGRRQMNPTAIGLIVIFLVVGCVVGWFSQKTTAAHADVKVAKTRLAGGRRTRWRSAILVFVVGAIVILAVKDFIHPGN